MGFSQDQGQAAVRVSTPVWSQGQGSGCRWGKSSFWEVERALSGVKIGTRPWAKIRVHWGQDQGHCALEQRSVYRQ